jgi:hypothetical protein
MELHDRRHCDLFAVANGIVYVERFIDAASMPAINAKLMPAITTLLFNCSRVGSSGVIMIVKTEDFYFVYHRTVRLL